MSAKKLFDSIAVESPCTADWNSMIGNDRVRVCEHCHLSVNNLSEMTYREALKLVKQSSGRLCVRYVRNHDGRIRTSSSSQVLHQIGRRASRIAAGAFSASLSLSSVTAAVTPSHPSTTEPASSVAERLHSVSTPALGGGMIRGTIFDPNGAVIPGAEVSLNLGERGYSYVMSTHWDGTYKFSGLETLTYSLSIKAGGFATTELTSVFLAKDSELQIDQTLSIASIEATVEIEGEEHAYSLQGAVAFVPPAEPLVRAAHEDDLQAVLSLVTRENVNVRDNSSDYTALDYAARNANRELVQLLLSAGADVNARDSGGRTALMLLDSDATPELVQELLSAGAKVNLRDNNGDTALTHMAEENNPEVLKALLAAGAKVNVRNNEGMTPLMIAADEGLVNNVRILIQAGAEITARNNEGESALSLAISGRHNAVARFLRALGAFEPEPKKEDDEDDDADEP